MPQGSAPWAKLVRVCEIWADRHIAGTITPAGTVTLKRGAHCDHGLTFPEDNKLNQGSMAFLRRQVKYETKPPNYYAAPYLKARGKILETLEERGILRKAIRATYKRITALGQATSWRDLVERSRKGL